MGCGKPLSAAVVAVALLLAPAAHATAPPSPWDGTNPFHCTVQDAGTGTAVPDPGADPYCVHFDKTDQNITQLGMADFLLKEPARVAAAVPKCFYYQEDHWRGSIVQGDGATILYEVIGHYFFNKATGDGGVWVTGFSIAGQTFDLTALPGFPPQYGQYFGPGTGGMITHDDIPADPQCAALAGRGPGNVYETQAQKTRCISGHVIAGRSIGPLHLAMREDQIRARYGAPNTVKRGFLGYCAAGGGRILVGVPGDRSSTLGAGRGPAVVLLTTSPRFRLAAGRRALAVGNRTRWLQRVFPGARTLTRIGRTTVVGLRRGIVAGCSGGRVRYIAVYDIRVLRTARAVRSYLSRAS